MTNQRMSLDDVLGTIAIEEEKPSYDAMSRWVAEYPEYSSQIANYFATWAIQAARTDDCPPIDSDRIASRGVSYALSLLDKRDTAPSLFERTRLSNLSVEQLAEKTDLDDSILQKLNRRMVSKVPSECIRRIATALADSMDHVRQLITGPPCLESMQFKANRRPVAAQEDFKTAVGRSSLPPDVQRDWLKIATDENLQ